MAKIIFENQTSNIITEPFKFSGRCRIGISGVLDGADVITLVDAPNGEFAPVRFASWLSSEGDTFLPGFNADIGIGEIVEGTLVKFQIKNAGASTDISLTFYSDTYEV
jgi:hypothetical protein